jgi:hypothetical protein
VWTETPERVLRRNVERFVGHDADLSTGPWHDQGLGLSSAHN